MLVSSRGLVEAINRQSRSVWCGLPGAWWPGSHCECPGTERQREMALAARLPPTIKVQKEQRSVCTTGLPSLPFHNHTRLLLPASRHPWQPLICLHLCNSVI